MSLAIHLRKLQMFRDWLQHQQEYEARDQEAEMWDEFVQQWESDRALNRMAESYAAEMMISYFSCPICAGYCYEEGDTADCENCQIRWSVINAGEYTYLEAEGFEAQAVYIEGKKDGSYETHLHIEGKEDDTGFEPTKIYDITDSSNVSYTNAKNHDDLYGKPIFDAEGEKRVKEVRLRIDEEGTTPTWAIEKKIPILHEDEYDLAEVVNDIAENAEEYALDHNDNYRFSAESFEGKFSVTPAMRNSPSYHSWEEKSWDCLHDWQDEEFQYMGDSTYEIRAYCPTCHSTMNLTAYANQYGPDMFVLPGRRSREDFFDAEDYGVENVWMSESFRDWADDELRTHGENVSFEKWSQEEFEDEPAHRHANGQLSFVQWARDEINEEHHNAEEFCAECGCSHKDAESFNAENADGNQVFNSCWKCGSGQHLYQISRYPASPDEIAGVGANPEEASTNWREGRPTQR